MEKVGEDGGDVDISIKIEEGNDGGGDSHYHALGDAGRHRVRGKKLVVIVKETETEREQIIGCSTKIR